MVIEPMYGWRCRIGRITPATALEGIEEWRRWSPPGVAIMPSLINTGLMTHKDMKKMMSNVDRAAEDVAQAQVDVVIQCCAPGTFTQGPGTDEKVIARLKKITGKPATTMHQATIDAMKALGMKRIAMSTAYRDDFNKDMQADLIRRGFKILSVVGLNTADPKTLPFIGPERPFRAMVEAARLAKGKGADGVIFAGGGMRSFEMINAAERETGLPVVTGGQAGFWRCLRLAGIDYNIESLGSLFTK
ncbi:MAG: decarboxylase [Alphaproteobacteria bacterium]|nr:decarboxylase [Alphaproteobacteria bacterium]